MYAEEGACAAPQKERERAYLSVVSVPRKKRSDDNYMGAWRMHYQWTSSNSCCRRATGSLFTGRHRRVYSRATDMGGHDMFIISCTLPRAGTAESIALPLVGARQWTSTTYCDGSRSLSREPNCRPLRARERPIVLSRSLMASFSRRAAIPITVSKLTLKDRI